MRTIAIPYSGELLLAHLVACGLLVALDAAGLDGHMHHPDESLSFTPSVDVDDGLDDDAIAAAVRSTAIAAEGIVETDLVSGKRGNDRRSVIWARGSMANDTSQAGIVVQRRAELVNGAARAGDRPSLGVLAGLGAPASWGSERVKPSHGATALDGVLGNHTSDIVRGVLRPARAAASALAGADLWTTLPAPHRPQTDKTGWAPAGTVAQLAHQWLAVLGLGLLPVAHHPLAPSSTPACWSTRRPSRHGVTLPLLGWPSSLARVRAVIGLRALAALHIGSSDADTLPGRAELRALGVREVVVFERVVARGQGSSVAFSFRRGQRVAL